MMHRRFKSLLAAVVGFSLLGPAQAGELAGVSVPDSVTLANGSVVTLNGMGLREKMWIDIYVGSLYLTRRVNMVADVLSMPDALRIQMNFVYKDVSQEKLVKAWQEGFDKNQSAQKMAELGERIATFNALFSDSAKENDVYVFDYMPGTGTTISKNGDQLGLIEGEDFRNALVEIWLGNSPADSDLKEGMLGIK